MPSLAIAMPLGNKDSPRPSFTFPPSCFSSLCRSALVPCILGTRHLHRQEVEAHTNDPFM